MSGCIGGLYLFGFLSLLSVRPLTAQTKERAEEGVLNANVDRWQGAKFARVHDTHLRQEASAQQSEHHQSLRSQAIGYQVLQDTPEPRSEFQMQSDHDPVSSGSISRKLSEANGLDQQAFDKPQRGREGKRVKDHHARKRNIPETGLSSVHDAWEEREKMLRSLKQGSVPSSDASARFQMFPITKPALEGAQQGALAKLHHIEPGGRRLQSTSTLYGKRSLVSDRPNGVSEMPDPEAAAYLSEHESKDLGADVLNAAKLHYNQGGPGEPLNTDKHATKEEHVTRASNEAALSHHNQKAEAVASRYSSFQRAQVEDQVNLAAGAQEETQTQPSNLKQEGFPWYADYPPPSFPEDNLKKTNTSIYNDVLAASKQRQEAERTAQEQRKKAFKDNLAAAGKQEKVSIWARNAPKGPGDGGELPAGSYIFTASGSGQQSPGKAAADELNQLRARARVWMSAQESSLIESFLKPTDVMLEFGAGYSTMWFSQFVSEYYSIEHNATWFDEIKTLINSTRKNVHLQVVPVDKGYKGWGGGFEEGSYVQFQQYITAVDNFKVTRFDSVLVDGRARASCAEYVLKFLHPGSLVFIHDYQNRYFYHGTAEHYYDKVAETYDGQSLIVLRPKPEALKQAAREAVAGLAST